MGEIATDGPPMGAPDSGPGLFTETTKALLIKALALSTVRQRSQLSPGVARGTNTTSTS